MRTKTAVALAATAGGTVMTAYAGIYLMNYSPWEHPQDLTDGIRCLCVAVALLLVPAAMIVHWFIGEVRRQARQVNLSPWVQIAALEIVHHEWSEANRRWSAELTDSVMGPSERKW